MHTKLAALVNFGTGPGVRTSYHTQLLQYIYDWGDPFLLCDESAAREAAMRPRLPHLHFSQDVVERILCACMFVPNRRGIQLPYLHPFSDSDWTWMCDCDDGCHRLRACFICDAVPVCGAISNAYRAVRGAGMKCDMREVLAWYMVLREVSPLVRDHIDAICSVSDMPRSVAGDRFSRSMAVRLTWGSMGLLGEVVLARNAREMLQATSGTRVSEDAPLLLPSTLDWVAIGLARVHELGCVEKEVVCAKCKEGSDACECIWDLPGSIFEHSRRVMFKTNLQQLIEANSRWDAERGWVPLCVPPTDIPKGAFSRGGVSWECHHSPVMVQDGELRHARDFCVDATIAPVQFCALHYVGARAAMPAHPIPKLHVVEEPDPLVSVFM